MKIDEILFSILIQQFSATMVLNTLSLKGKLDNGLLNFSSILTLRAGRKLPSAALLRAKHSSL